MPTLKDALMLSATNEMHTGRSLKKKPIRLVLTAVEVLFMTGLVILGWKLDFYGSGTHNE